MRRTAALLQSRCERSGSKRLAEGAFAAWVAFTRSDVAFGRLVQTVASWLRRKMVTSFYDWREDTIANRCVRA